MTPPAGDRISISGGLRRRLQSVRDVEALTHDFIAKGRLKFYWNGVRIDQEFVLSQVSRVQYCTSAVHPGPRDKNTDDLNEIIARLKERQIEGRIVLSRLC